MHEAMRMVKEFQDKLYKNSRQHRLLNLPFHHVIDTSAALRASGETLAGVAARLEITLSHAGYDPRVLRAHLQVEELGEELLALANCDELAVLDALADLAYVAVGTAVTFDLPLTEAFDEVHRSNMTKERQSGDEGDRFRNKGPNWEAPDLGRVLKEHRR